MFAPWQFVSAQFSEDVLLSLSLTSVFEEVREGPAEPVSVMTALVIVCPVLNILANDRNVNTSYSDSIF